MRYGVELDEYVLQKKAIPYRLHEHSRFRNNCFYWIDYWGKWLKVIKAEYEFGYVYPRFIGAYVRWSDGNMGYISTDLVPEDFKIEVDNASMFEKQIVNTGESYTGAEIEYWLFVRGIDRGRFKKFKHILNDLDPFTYYFVNAKVCRRGRFYDVTISVDKNKPKKK